MSPFIRTLVAAIVVFAALSYFAILANAAPIQGLAIGLIGAMAVLAFGHIRARRSTGRS